MKKNIKTHLISSAICSTISIASIATAITIPTISDTKLDLLNKLENKVNEFNEITPSDYYYQSPLLTQETGPIISYNSKIASLDWFGSKRWEIDLSSSNFSKYIPGTNTNPKYGEGKGQYTPWTNRLFINWTLDIKNHYLWLLTNAQITNGSTVTQQNVIQINSLTGAVINKFELNKGITNYDYSKYALFYQISALESGNILIYSKGSEQWGANIVLDPKTGNVKFNSHGEVSAKNPKINKAQTGNGQKRGLFLLPISKNVNVYMISDFNQSHQPNKGNGDLYLTLVNDNLEEIPVNDSNSPWKQMIKIENNTSKSEQKWYDNANRFSKSYYKTLDNKTYFTAFGSFFVFDNTLNPNYGINLYEFKLDSGKAISSFTMDVNENVFLKYFDDTNIKKLDIHKSSNGNVTFSFNTYYDLNGSSLEDVKKYSKNYILFNVTNQTGSIMIINTRQINQEKGFNPDEKENTNKYGLAAAIVPNKESNTSGDSKGLLNGENSILKSADFDINPEILKTKLPSEITRSDLEIKNNGFFTTNSKKDDNGKLLYPPFSLTNINDKEGSFTVTAYLDQIPWFTNTLPSDAIPKKIEKTYNNGQLAKISSKTSWKDKTNLTYDFKNMLPTDVKVGDIEEFDPFQVSFNSRTVIDSSGKQQYPKKTYSIKTTNDNTGQITIGVKYDYMPVSNEVNSPQTYETQQEYTIFKKTDQQKLYFAGTDQEATVNTNNTIDINTVPQLKALSQSNLLPSSFNGKDKNAFLQFINTNKSTGYPISRMNFNVQANDNDGSLIITATTKNKKFTQKYVGFNKTNAYKFSFKEENTIDNKPFSTMLPSSINEGDIIDNLVTYSGFNSSDFKVTLYPNDNNGSLNVQIDLNKDYAESLGNQYGFSQYRATKVYSGFMNTEQYNSKYNVSFRTNDDKTLVDIKKNALDKIYNQIKDEHNNINVSKPININNKRYENLNDLIQQVFVESKGTNIPQDWSKNTDKIKSNIAIDNQAGTMNLSISIDKSLLNGYDSNLNYVVSYSGFARGNIEVTDDTFTFIEGNLLSAVLPENVVKMKASEMTEWLKGKTEQEPNIKKIIFNLTGQYQQFLNEGKYELEIESSDAYKTLTVTIKFTGDLNNKKSLKEYSIQYKL